MEQCNQILEGEKKLRQDLSMLIEMINAVPLCMALWSRDQHLIAGNAMMISLFEVEDFEDLRQYFFIFSPEYQPDGSQSNMRIAALIEDSFRKGKNIFPWTHCNKRGEMIPSEMTLTRIICGDADILICTVIDLRAQIAAEKAEKIAMIRSRAVIDATPLACFLWNEDGELMSCNRLAAKMLGVETKQEIIDDIYAFYPEFQPDGKPSREKAEEMFEDCFKKKNCIFEWVYRSRQGENIPCEVTLVRQVVEEELIVIGYGRDLRELKNTLRLNKKLTRLAYKDLLTGSASRAAFMEKFTQNFTSLEKRDSLLFLIFDIDHFKSVNDTYGHEAGDLALKKVVDKISSIWFRRAVIGRFGGDEFMIQATDLTREDVESLVDRMVDEVCRMDINYETRSFSVSISVGGTFRRPQDKDQAEMISRADKALYEAKEKGKNCSVII